MCLSDNSDHWPTRISQWALLHQVWNRSDRVKDNDGRPENIQVYDIRVFRTKMRQSRPTDELKHPHYIPCPIAQMFPIPRLKESPTGFREQAIWEGPAEEEDRSAWCI